MFSARRLPVLLAGVAIAAVSIAVAQQLETPNGPGRNPSDDQTARVVRRQYVFHPAPEATTQATAPRARYNMLLRQIDVPDDQKSYGDFCDFGYWSGASYAGNNDLPAGYWVYLAPKWYIFKDEVPASANAPQTPRSWGPEQAIGAPNTWPNSGDLTTAWASATPDGQREWLELTYKDATRPAAVLVYETYNPGAVDRVTGYDANGKEVDLWSGADPTPAGTEKGISVIPVHPDFDLTKIRIYLDSPKVPGWNEIDAVGLLDATGTTHWADGATASSSYADRIASPEEIDIYHRLQGAPGSGEIDELKLNTDPNPANHPR